MSDWAEIIRAISIDDVADQIASHFVPLFLYKWLPAITIQFDDAKPENITQRFQKIFVESDAGTFATEVDGEPSTIYYSIAKIPKTRSFKSHCLLFSAADRIVGAPRDISTKLGNPYFVDENNDKYIIIGILRSDAFEKRLNDSRTSINIGSKTIDNLVTLLCDKIEASERQQIEKIKVEQSNALDGALRENPILRIGLRGRTVRDYVAKKPNHWTAEQFIADLAIERLRATEDLTKSITFAANDAENYEKNIREIVGKIDDAKKEIPAEYVIHRKSIIDLISAARKFGVDGRRQPEDAIHDLVFRRFHDSSNVKYFDHNLWLIDDALAFLPYITSDRSAHGGKRKKGDKVPDLLFFDDSMILGDNDGTTIIIVEFKKPSRKEYKFGSDGLDPVLQVINTLELATSEGGITRVDGEHFSFTNVVRRFAFIIADTTPSFVALLRKHDFKNSWNPRVYFRFRENEQIYIEAFGYDTMIENAKKRNQAFFRVLLDE